MIEFHYPDRAVIYCFMMGVLLLGSGFVFSFLLAKQPLSARQARVA